MTEGQEKSTPQPRCTICGTQTLHACADCQIDLRTSIYVCAQSECRDEHEKDCPDSLRKRIRELELAALRSVAGGEPEQWISPQADLPDEDEAVLVAVSCESDDGDGLTQYWQEVHEATLYKGAGQLIAACFADNAEYADGEILGWMPLPAPPQGKEQK